jgi:hypothetical protein
MTGGRRAERATRLLAACGAVAPVLDVLITGWLGFLDPGYSHAQQYISELGEDGRPSAAAFNAWCVAYGGLFAGFAVALGRELDSRPLLTALLVIAVSSVAGGVFPCDPGCAGQSPAARMHVAAGYLGLSGMILAPFLAWFGMKKRPAWRGYRAFTLATGCLLVAGTGWLATGHYVGHRQAGWSVGAAQRLVLGVQYVWMLVLTVRLWVLLGRRSSPDAPA